MLVNNFVYFHIGVCVALIIYEFWWKIHLKRRDKKIKRKSEKYIKEIKEQVEFSDPQKLFDNEYKAYLKSQLRNTDNLLAFEKAYDEIFITENDKICAAEELQGVFSDITQYYILHKGETEKAYIAYLLGKYFEYVDVSKQKEIFIKVLYEMLESKVIYTRINALKSLCKLGKTEQIIRAIDIINIRGDNYNNEMLSNILKSVKKDRQNLANDLYARFEKYNKNTQLAIIKFLAKYPLIEEDRLIQKLKSDFTDTDVRCEILRYFDIHKNQKVKEYLMNKLAKEKSIVNDFNLKAVGTLGYYEDDDIKVFLNYLKETENGRLKETVYRSIEKNEKLNMAGVG